MGLVTSLGRSGGLGVAGLALLAACAEKGSNGPTEADDPGTPTRGILANDDPAAHGIPAAKRSYTEGLALSQGAPDHFDFTDDDHRVTRVTLHGTQLEIALDNRAVLAGGPPPAEFADLMIAAFHQAWHVFGGFPYDRYAVRVRPADGGPFSLSPVGITITDADYRAPSLREFAVHEMFHSWNGGILRPLPDGTGNLFQWETWLVEGATVYYSFRLLGLAGSPSEFQTGMSGRWTQYQQLRGTVADQPISGLAAAIGDSPPGDPSMDHLVRMLYARGALVAYMLDEELTRRGHNLDLVLARMYGSALGGESWTRASLAAAIQSVTGTSFESFLADWLDTNQALPLTATFTLNR